MDALKNLVESSNQCSMHNCWVPRLLGYLLTVRSSDLRECSVKGFGFSPFELLLVEPQLFSQDCWNTLGYNSRRFCQIKTCFQFVNDLTDNLHKIMQIAEMEARKARKQNQNCGTIKMLNNVYCTLVSLLCYIFLSKLNF